MAWCHCFQLPAENTTLAQQNNMGNAEQLLSRQRNLQRAEFADKTAQAQMAKAYMFYLHF